MAQGMRKAPAAVTAAVLRNTAFFYDQTFIFTSLNEVQTPTIQIQADAHFVVVATMYDTNQAGASFGGGLVQIQDVSGQRLLSKNQIPFDTIFGTGQRPFVWPFTHIFRANGGIQLTATNLFNGAQTVRLVFAGYKVPVGSVNLVA